MSKQAERDYAEKVEQSHLFIKPFNDPRVFREFAVVLEIFGEKLKNQGKILDIGCGPGWTSRFLARAGYDVVGVDLAERMIEIAKEQAITEGLNIRFRVADMEHLDVAEYDFDGAMYFDCLHHCPEYPLALKRAAAHIKPGGYILLFETTWLHRYSPHAKETTREFGVTELGFSARQLKSALRDAGFVDPVFYHDPGPSYRGFRGFLKASLRFFFSYWFVFPQTKNIILARKS